MKKFILLFTLLICFSCSKEDNSIQETPNTNPDANKKTEYLIKSIASESGIIKTYSYDKDNRLESINYFDDLKTKLSFTYNSSNQIAEIIEKPVRLWDKNDNPIEGYRKITFNYVSKDEIIANFKAFKDDNSSYGNSSYVKYKFEGNLIKSYKHYYNDENKYNTYREYLHDDLGRITEIHTYNKPPNSEGYGIEKTKFSSWDDNKTPSLIKNYIRGHFLYFFSQKYVSTKNPKNHQSFYTYVNSNGEESTTPDGGKTKVVYKYDSKNGNLLQYDNKINYTYIPKI